MGAHSNEEIDSYIRDKAVMALVQAFYKRALLSCGAGLVADALDVWLTRIIVMGTYTHYH